MENLNILLPLTIGLAVILTIGLLHFWRKHNRDDDLMPTVKVLRSSSPLLTWIKYKRRPGVILDWTKIKNTWLMLTEISLIVVWSFWIGREYLDFDPDMVSPGPEFIMGIQNHYIWQLLGECGGCIYWNGFTNGGAPAFVDIHSAWLHPIVALSTLIWGEINGAKATIIAALIMAGFAQWYLAKVLNLGTTARVWSACIAVAGGHLAGRMQAGLVALLLSTAACSLVIPFAVDLVWNKNRRAAVGCGVTLGLALLAGQGYLQIGLFLSLFPAILLLYNNSEDNRRSMVQNFIWVGLLTILIAGILWVPFIHFLPYWSKYGSNNFAGSMPLAYGPLTLVMDDTRFYNPDIFQGGIYLYVNYITWVAVILALTSFFLAPLHQRRLQFFFILAIILTYLNSASVPYKLLMTIWPEASSGIHYPAAISGLAVPFVLGLAAWGFDSILKLNWPNLVLVHREILKVKYIFMAKTSWLLLLPLIWSMSSAAKFTAKWFWLLEANETDRIIIKQLVTPNAEWVQPPWGEYYWFAYAREIDIKITDMFRPWFWKDREKPVSYLEQTRNEIDPATPNFLGVKDGVGLFLFPDNEYAFVETVAGRIPCQAQSQGGNIDLVCQTGVEGELVVQENSWTGWFAWQDGNSIDLLPGNRLRVKAPAGSHRYTFRYRPWDAQLGIVLSLFGIVLAIILWFRWSPAVNETTVADAKGTHSTVAIDIKTQPTKTEDIESNDIEV